MLFNMLFKWVKNLYEKHYKALLIIPFILLIASVIVIVITTIQTGTFFHRGVSLKGGTTIDIQLDRAIEVKQLSEELRRTFPHYDFEIRLKRSLSGSPGLYIGVDTSNQQDIKRIIEIVAKYNAKPIDNTHYNIGYIGPQLSKSFFKGAIIGLIASFILMGLVVLIYFRTLAPSLAVILAALSDIIVTIAIFDLLGIKIGVSSLAAFLMLIGYSVDTDILLSTRVLRRREGTVMDRVYSAMKTGLMMTLTTLTAVIIAYMLSTSHALRQIMLVLLIGLLVDLINTWIQNVGILRIYLEKKHKT